MPDFGMNERPATAESHGERYGYVPDREGFVNVAPMAFPICYLTVVYVKNTLQSVLNGFPSSWLRQCGKIHSST
jgi:hypothetical protein